MQPNAFNLRWGAKHDSSFQNLDFAECYDEEEKCKPSNGLND